MPLRMQAVPRGCETEDRRMLRRSVLRRRLYRLDVLIESKHIAWIVAILDVRQPNVVLAKGVAGQFIAVCVLPSKIEVQAPMVSKFSGSTPGRPRVQPMTFSSSFASRQTESSEYIHPNDRSPNAVASAGTAAVSHAG
jgi:hypothetical protein